jgi:hypothetical protein
MKPVSERFWEKVQKGDGCWEWQGAFFRRGYGAFKVLGKTVKAHRFSYEMDRGPIPSGMFVCHSCDNPGCVRPEHLFLGTPDENVQDMMSKGRAGNPRRHEAQRMRLVAPCFTQYHLAELFDVCQQTVSLVLRRGVWKGLSQRQAH